MTQSWNPPPGVVPQVAAQPPRRSIALTVLTVLMLVLSIGANAVLLVVVIALAAAVAGGNIDDSYLERLVEEGPSAQKIAVIRVEGILYDEVVEPLRRQLKRAAKDDKVRAVILRINSPGGGLTASDMMYHEVRQFIADSGKPVVASMDSVAASGGYYVACAAGDIVAQETTVTGSIGVIAQFFFLNELMKDKLGITPVTLKMGEQKDWPNTFGATAMTPEQQEYLMATLLRPGYDRFVDVVAEARKMDRDDVLKVATGRIFMAPDAKDKGLVDEIGYMDRAIAIAMKRAGLTQAKVVEYVQPFSFFEFMGASSKAATVLDLRPERLAGLSSPRVMLLWTGM
jgi:protease-4